MGNKQSKKKQQQSEGLKQQQQRPGIANRASNRKLVESLSHNFNVQKIIAYWIRNIDDKARSFLISMYILNEDMLGLLCKYSVTSYRYIFGYGCKQIKDQKIIHNAIFVQKENLFLLNMKQNIIPYDYANMYGQCNISKIIDGGNDNINHFDEILISNGLASEHCFIMKNNIIYGLGRNIWGQLGIMKKSFSQETPMQIQNTPFKSKILSIVCGAEHSLFLSLNGKIFSCGHSQYGQLGRTLTVGEKYSCEIKPVPYVASKCGEKIKEYVCKQIECTRWTSFAIIDDSIYVFGANDCGLLCINSEDVNKSQRIPSRIGFEMSGVVDMKCGVCHICVLTDKGDVYCWGHALAIGCGEERGMRTVPIKVQSVRNVVGNTKKIACGDYHCILQTNDDDIVAFGKNQYGQCLNGTTGGKLMTPTLIKRRKLLKEYNTQKKFDNCRIHIFGATGTTLIGVE